MITALNFTDVDLQFQTSPKVKLIILMDQKAMVLF